MKITKLESIQNDTTHFDVAMSRDEMLMNTLSSTDIAKLVINSVVEEMKAELKEKIMDATIKNMPEIIQRVGGELALDGMKQRVEETK